MIKHYRYDMEGADLEYGVHEHPQRQMKKLGFHVIGAEAFPIGDCWVFRVDNEIENVPPYLIDIENENFEFTDEWREREKNERGDKKPGFYTRVSEEVTGHMEPGCLYVKTVENGKTTVKELKGFISNENENS